MASANLNIINDKYKEYLYTDSAVNDIGNHISESFEDDKYGLVEYEVEDSDYSDYGSLKDDLSKLKMELSYYYGLLSDEEKSMLDPNCKSFLDLLPKCDLDKLLNSAAKSAQEEVILITPGEAADYDKVLTKYIDVVLLRDNGLYTKDSFEAIKKALDYKRIIHHSTYYIKKRILFEINKIASELQEELEFGDDYVDNVKSSLETFKDYIDDEDEYGIPYCEEKYSK